MRTSERLQVRRRHLLGLLGAVAGALVVAAPAAAGTLYTQTNAPVNEIVVFDRANDGTLQELDRVATGGSGSPASPPFDQAHLDSTSAVELTDNGRLLFAVNAGSGTLSSFRVAPHGGVTLVDVESSQGVLPVSVDTHKGLLYVLNELSGTIAGFRYDNDGEMTLIAGSVESLSTPGGGGLASQVGFDPKGEVLAVTLRLTDTIDTFVLNDDGTPGPAVANAANAPIPFAFVYDNDRMFVAQAGPIPAFTGSASSYLLGSDGTLTGLDNESADAIAACWIVITNSGRYVFTSNTGSNSLSRFSVGEDADLTLLGTLSTPVGSPSDLALSKNSRYMYVLNVFNPAGASISAYRVSAKGDLTLLGTTPTSLAPGATGLASD